MEVSWAFRPRESLDQDILRSDGPEDLAGIRLSRLVAMHPIEDMLFRDFGFHDKKPFAWLPSVGHLLVGASGGHPPRPSTPWHNHIKKQFKILFTRASKQKDNSEHDWSHVA